MAPSSKPGQQVVVMDNLSAHESEEVRELIEGRGRELLFLPPYSPDLDPIEGAFSKIKGPFAQGASPHPRGTDRGDGGRAISAVTAGDAAGFFEHCGYRRVGQLL